MDKYTSKQKIITEGALFLNEDTSSEVLNEKVTKEDVKDKMIKAKGLIKKLMGLKPEDLVKERSSITEIFKLVLGTTALLLVLNSALIALLGSLTASFINNKVKDSERKKLKSSYETQLKIVKEKLEDAKKEDNKKEKYKLMKLESELENNIKKLEKAGI